MTYSPPAVYTAGPVLYSGKVVLGVHQKKEVAGNDNANGAVKVEIAVIAQKTLSFVSTAKNFLVGYIIISFFIFTEMTEKS